MMHGLGTDVLVSGNLVMWWLHGLMGVAFIALATRTPMSHMVLGPINSALAHPRPGINLSPIDFDAEDDTGKALFSAPPGLPT
ncbi:MAG: hypothetical protein IPJ52_07575 [Rhodocyclaceae bacterium]|nr:hypothetical protein [Rhodocyclaceae bacterium]